MIEKGRPRRRQSNHRTTTLGMVVRVLACLAGIGCVVAVNELATAEKPVIALRSRATATSPMILLGDVSEILTNDPRMQEALAAIDLAELPHEDEVVSIPDRQISLRLQIAGFSQDSFKLVGADSVKVSAGAAEPITETSPGKESLEQRILDSLRKKLANQWNVRGDALDVRLTKPLPSLDEFSPAEIDDIDVTVAPGQRPGAMRPRIYLRRRRQLLTVWHLPVEALIISDVVTVTAPISSGDVLSADNVESNRRPLRHTNQVTDLKKALGKIARRPLQPGQIVHANDLQQKPQTTDYAIRRRDVVQLIVRKGSLLVTIANAEAIQDANIGDTIRVRNPSSKKIVVGRVVNANQVQVTY